jgi:hypothetical protein
VKDGRYDGKVRLADHFQPLINESLRTKLGLTRSDREGMVRKPARSDASNPLREGEVLTAIGTTAVDNEALIDFEDGLRLPFPVLAPRLERDGKVPVRLIRDGKPLESAIPAKRADDRLIRPYAGQYPPYFVRGPLVFSPAHAQALPFYAEENPLAMLGSPLATREFDRVAFPEEELAVVTAPMLSIPITRGYTDSFGQLVKDVDGVEVKNLHHLLELLRAGKGEYVTLRFFGEASETLVFPRQALADSTVHLLTENGIPRRGSDDVMAVWITKFVKAP